MHYYLRELEKLLILGSRSPNSKISFKRSLDEKYLIMVDRSLGSKINVLIDTAPFDKIRLSLQLTGSLSEVDNQTYRDVRNYIDVLATRAGVQTPYSLSNDVLGIAVSFKVLPYIANYTSFNKQLQSGLTELKSFYCNYKNDIDEYLISKNCPLA